MSNPSISAIRLPSIRRHWRGLGFARRIILRQLDGLSRGSLTINEGDQVLHYGVRDSDGVHAVVNVHDAAMYHHVLLAGVLGAGESYMQKHWSSPELVKVIQLFCANMETMEAMEDSSSLLQRWGAKALHLLNNNSLLGSKRNIGAHYDLGNEFFSLFLDQSMMYSSAVYPSADASLEQASEYKLELLCQDLELSAEDHLLEIGTGWGGMAIYAAKHYGCTVTTTTISREQFEYAREQVKREGLCDRVTVLCEDYRKLRGRYDKIVSIEMIEAVGHQYYSEYFSRCNALLKPGGKFVIQAITMQDQRYREARDSVDFIKRYIFPGGCLPSLEVISRHIARDTHLQIVNLRDITPDYARTLEDWRSRFLKESEAVAAQGFDDTFVRMWEFYLCYCEGGFRERAVSTVQLSFASADYRFPS